MYEFFKEVRELKYTSNSYSDAKHENEIKNLLIKHGFSEKIIDTKKLPVIAIRDSLLEEEQTYIDIIQNNEFVYQFCGKNDSPDFVLKLNDKFYFIECKTNKNGSFPVYNSGKPKQKYIYIFSSGKHNQTTFFWGRDIITKEKDRLFSNLLENMNKMIKETELDPAWKDDVGLSFYCRAMYNHIGKSDKTDYIEHKYRTTREENVLNEFLQN